MRLKLLSPSFWKNQTSKKTEVWKSLFSSDKSAETFCKERYLPYSYETEKLVKLVILTPSKFLTWVKWNNLLTFKQILLIRTTGRVGGLYFSNLNPGSNCFAWFGSWETWFVVIVTKSWRHHYNWRGIKDILELNFLKTERSKWS